MKMTSEERCGAWCCLGFACRDYSEISYNCTHDLCHVCSSGCFCTCCEDFDICSDGIDNVEFQERRFNM